MFSYELACQTRLKCNGIIDCPWLDPHDEAFCTKCPSPHQNRCDCNKPGAVTCKGRGKTCYSDKGQISSFQHCRVSPEIYLHTSTS